MREGQSFFEFVTTDTKAARAVEAILAANPLAIGLDTETAWWRLGGAYEMTSIIQIAVPMGNLIKVFIFDCLADQEPIKIDRLIPILSGPILKVAHNASYDIRLLYKSFGILVKNVWCTMECERRVMKHQKIKRAITLAAVVQDRLAITMSKEEQISSWENRPLTKSQLIYAANDALNCLKVYEVQASMELDGNYSYVPELAVQEQESLIEEETRLDKASEFLKEILVRHRYLKEKVMGFESFRGRRVDDVLRFIQELLKMVRLMKTNQFLAESDAQQSYSLCTVPVTEEEVLKCIDRLQLHINTQEVT